MMTQKGKITIKGKQHALNKGDKEREKKKVHRKIKDNDKNIVKHV